ncbi:hypothetical protein NC653_007045 [Populus alba x Populus x berolinensis]|uniref:Uncharacterized protein n=1 Tax=Populus alba x Populus x berolinensis TaxID=444605 RepID=A0AAD6RGY2_9ROSI|nr:hypothetical protein NC653_007045 [Populus alba x Populus x berolinensis]
MAMARASSGPTYPKRFYAALYQQQQWRKEIILPCMCMDVPVKLTEHGSCSEIPGF